MGPAVGAMRVRDSSELTRVSVLELSVLVEKLVDFVVPSVLSVFRFSFHTIFS